MKAPAIEFSARVFCVNPTDDKVQLKVVRRGSKDNKIVFQYQTVDGTAKENIHFVPVSEQCTIESGETEKLITISLIVGAEWKSNDMFTVKLSLSHIAGIGDMVKLGKCNLAEIIYFGNEHDVTNKMKDVEMNEDYLSIPSCEVQFVKRFINVKINEGTVRVHVIRNGNYTVSPLCIFSNFTFTNVKNVANHRCYNQSNCSNRPLAAGSE